MAHTFAHGRVARRLSLVAALALAGTIVTAPMTRAADRLDIRTLSLSISASTVSGAAGVRSDWVEHQHNPDFGTAER